ncbi:hypothetical protein IP81_15955 [Novosphingobium sp. AAP83]|uniref:beta strand repeat-containing protein n=1 Tax=Novosphingobium sp. AAP83 TaxID=1523425 RepID=UPI0006B932F8|nr:FG-GAP-like repeat-containing protein [Novosphingobium sp. AAP83]KPF90064.1 hypothetical protein IP81_15955 [Novosphingobium sp. AAP83]
MSNPPVNIVPGVQTVAEDTALTFSTANSNLISVSDDLSTTLTVSITAASGWFSLSRTTGLTFSAGSNGSAAMTFTGTTTNLNAALAGARYNGNLNFNGAGSVVIATTDQNVPALTDTDTIAITVTARNDQPGAIGGSSNILLNGTKVFSLADFPFTDVEGNSLASILVNNVPLNGSLTLDADGAGGNAPVAVTAAQSITAADIAAGKLVYTAGSLTNTATFRYQIVDDGGRANGGSNMSGPATRTIYTVNIPPAVNAGLDIEVTSGTAAALTGLSVSDDNATLTATFTVANGALTLRTDVAGGLTASSIVSGINGAGTIVVRGTPAAINATLSAPNGLTYIGDEADTLTLRVSDAINTTAQSVGFFSLYGDGIHSTAIADVTGDGLADIITASASGGAITVGIQTSTGGFNPVNVFTGQNGNAVDAIVTSTNSGMDSSPDLLVASLAGAVTSFINTGTGAFAQNQVISIPVPNAIVAGDFNSDGFADFATANRNGTVSVALHNGTSLYLAPTSYATSGFDPVNWDIVSADFDEDGDLDLLISSGGVVSSGGGIYLMRGNGNGTFAAASAVAAVSGASQIATADFNNDGNIDFAVASWGTSTVRVFLGTGTGAFANGVSYSAVSSASGLVAGDFNGDGIVDLAVGGVQNPQYRYLLGSGDGTFTPGNMLTGAILSGAAGDIDGDGDLDIAAAAWPGPLVLSMNRSPAGIATDQAQITIAPADLFDVTSPTDADDASDTVAENAAVGTAVGITAFATDADATNNTVTYSLINDAGGRFAINPTTGVVTVAGALDYESGASHDITVGAASSDGSTSDAMFTITVGDVNEAPSITSNGAGATAAISIAENTTAVTDVDATDGDAGSVLTYEIVGGADAAAFAIDSATGALSLLVPANFEAPADVGGDNIYEVIVGVSDGLLSDTQTLNVTITDAIDGPQIVTLTLGNDSYTAATNEDYVIDGLEGDDTITTGSGNDIVHGNWGSDTISTGDGDDVITYDGLEFGADIIDGGAGDNDQIIALNDNTVIRLRSFTGIETISANGKAGVSVSGSILADTLDFSSVNMVGITVFNAGSGNDHLTGTAAADTIIGARGQDTLIGGGGDDVFGMSAGSGIDSIDGGTGYDTLSAMSANAVFYWGTFSNIEAISGNGFAGARITGLETAETIAFSGLDLTDIAIIDGGGGNDTITGTAQGDTIFGNTGDDTINAAGGDDTILFRGITLDVVDGGSGIDTLRATARGSSIRWDLISNVEAVDGAGFDRVTVTGSTAADTLDLSGATLTDIALIDGGGGNDTITGTAQGDTIFGNTGDDTINAAGGDDTILFRGITLDVVDGGSGIDTLRATATGSSIRWDLVSNVEAVNGAGFDRVTLIGSTAADTLDLSGVTLTDVALIDAGAGNDTVIGSAGADVLLATAGKDSLTGGGGADTFRFNATGDSRTGLAWDSITDFMGGEDKIDLSRIDAVSRSPGDQAFTFIGTGGFSKTAGELRYDNGTTDYTRILGDVNGDGIADFEIRLDWIGANPHILSAADFIL